MIAHNSITQYDASVPIPEDSTSCYSDNQTYRSCKIRFDILRNLSQTEGIMQRKVEKTHTYRSIHRKIEVIKN